MSATRVYLVEDHNVLRGMLREFLDMTPDISVSGVANNAETALQELPNLDIDLLLIDVSLTGMSGIALAKTIADRWPDVTCIMFSAHEEASYARRALSAGARGYVLKGNPEELVTAVRQVLRGEIYVSTALQRKLAGTLKEMK